MKKKKETWYLYIVRCSNDAFYTGITKDIPNRVEKHNSGKGAKFTRTYRPCELVYFETLPSVQDAMKREIAVKKLSRAKKEDIVNSFPIAELEKV
ncbi:MAG: GIY-YIG nuclease family protein [candidate division Zixibacteria bacterium]|nr:GIY-YIG nuclease family protein [candidate division Zixibacteria bacterium]